MADEKLTTADTIIDEEEIESTPIYRKKRILIPLLIFIFIGVAAWYWYMGNKGYVSTDDAFIDADKATISSKILGRIVDLKVAEGDTVKMGQVLIRLDTTDLKAQEKQFEAATASATESITLAKVNVEKAQEDFDRASNQYKTNIITKEQYDHAVKALDVAKAEYNISLTKPALSKSQQEVVLAQLKNTTIYSQIDGVIAKRWVLEGDVIQPGQPVYTIFDTKNLWITAEFEETRLALISVGDDVEISVDAFPGQKFTGKVFQIGSNTASQFSLIPPNNASGNFTKVTQRVPVKISIDKEKNNVTLLPGMSVEVRVKEKN
ncbi:MAG: HlyD family secretion protein [Ignavibacteriaceae bacterium]|nr:HlyD family secretion protein [Ignavibacteriaceae bacterium]